VVYDSATREYKDEGQRKHVVLCEEQVSEVRASGSERRIRADGKASWFRFAGAQYSA